LMRRSYSSNVSQAVLPNSGLQQTPHDRRQLFLHGALPRLKCYRNRFVASLNLLPTVADEGDDEHGQEDHRADTA
jgi:hypothetical protein